MTSSSAALPPLTIEPLTPERWADFETLFGPRGAYGGCWCMYWRLTMREFDQGKQNQGEGNRRALRGLVQAGHVPGLLAYAEGQPIGWVAVAPREAFGRIERSPTLRRLDDRPTWSINCFFVAQPHRRAGLMEALLRAAVDYAAQHGAEVVEGYPVDPADRHVTTVEAYTGVASVFRRAGFKKVRRQVRGKVVSRYQKAVGA